MSLFWREIQFLTLSYPFQVFSCEMSLVCHLKCPYSCLLLELFISYSRDTTIRIHIPAETKSTIMTNEYTSLEKYTSHSLFEMVVKGLRKGYV